MKTMYQYGLDLLVKGLKGPVLKMEKNLLIMQPGYRFYRVGRRSLKNVFVMEKSGYATVYVRSGYRDYRKAFQSVFGNKLDSLKDVDHLYPKSKAKASEFLALGIIDKSVNRSISDNDTPVYVAIKAMNMKKYYDSLITNYPRAIELGRFVLAKYISPLDEMDTNRLNQVSLSEIIKA
ncbi:TPA: hypothetical protein I7284_24190 [Vibrio parahaemolyticus]|nr:hypothetical protein [Vibrio parahaemolyticus]